MSEPSPGSGREPESAETPSALTNTAIAGVMFMGRAALAFATVILITRGLSTADRGKVVYITNLAGLLSMLASAGIVASITTLYSQRRVGLLELVRAASRVGLVASAVAAIPMLILGYLKRDSIQLSNLSWLLVLVALGSLVEFANRSQVASLANRISLVAVSALAGSLLYLIWSAIEVSNKSISVHSNIVGWSISAIVPVALIGVRRRWLTSGEVPLQQVRTELLSATLRSNLASLAVLVIWKLDVVLVEAARGFDELGLYSTAVAVAEMVMVAAIAVRSAMLAHHAEPDAVLVPRLARVSRVALAGASLIGVAVAVVGSLLMPIVFGAEYGEARWALVLLIPGVVALVSHFPLFDFLIARGYTRELTVLGGSALALNLIGNVVLLQFFNFNAASVVSTLTYALVLGGCVRMFAKHGSLNAREVLLIGADDLRMVRSLVPIGRRAPR